MRSSPILPPDPTSGSARAPLTMAALTLTASLVLLVVVLQGLMRAPPPPVIASEPPAGRPLSSHVLLVLVDGLRYRDAIDPARMPHFSQHMRDDTHALLWAGRITMTSATVLTVGTGLRGDFAQVVTNVDAGRTQASELFGEARSRGLRTGLVGDDTWVKLYGAFDEQAAHEHELALGVDNSVEMIDAATKMMALPDRPAIAVAHFVSADSVGHAIGAGNPAYLEMLRTFDQRLSVFLDGLPADQTVLAISDHGMKANGTHGADSTEERSCPLFARGPGIRAGIDLGTVDQIDLASTLAALLGISAPNGNRGTAVTEMLDVTPAQAADLVCADARRVERLARAEGLERHADRALIDLAGCRGTDPASRLAAGRRVVRAYESERETAVSTAGVVGAWISASILAMLVVAAAWLGARSAGSKPRLAQAIPALLLGAIAVGLVYGVEKITPPWHNVARALVYVVGNAPLAALLLLPDRAAPFFRRHAAVAFAIVPCGLAFTFPGRLQMEALVVIAIAVLLLSSGEEPLRPRLPPLRVLVPTLLALAALFPAARYVDLPDALAAPPQVLAITGTVLAAAWLGLGATWRDGRFRAGDVALSIAAATGGLWLGRHVTSSIGAAAALGFALSGTMLFRTRRTLAAGLLFGAYAWVSRDVEVIPVVGAALAAEVLSQQTSAALSRDRLLDKPLSLALLAGAFFGLLFLVRVAVQGGVDFVTIDWAAGTFGDDRAPAWHAGVANGWKYLSAAGLVTALLLARAPRDARLLLLASVSLLFAIRASTLAWELFACRASYFTAFHAFGDLPSALTYSAGSAVLLVITARLVVSPSPGKASVAESEVRVSPGQ